MNWGQLSDLVSSLVKSAGVKWIVGLIMRFLSLSGGVWTWIVTYFVTKYAEKALEEIDQEADKADQKNIDKENSEDLQKVIDDPASTESDVIQAGGNLLNGIKKTKKD